MLTGRLHAGAMKPDFLLDETDSIFRTDPVAGALLILAVAAGVLALLL